jgi:hypothetical protein
MSNALGVPIGYGAGAGSASVDRVRAEADNISPSKHGGLNYGRRRR